jgi:flagellar protein FliO/FliZ
MITRLPYLLVLALAWLGFCGAALAAAGAAADTAAVPGAPAAAPAAAPALAPATPGTAPQPGYARRPLPNPAPAPLQSAPGASGGKLVQTIAALALVLGLLAGVAWLMKRFSPQRPPGSANLRIVGALNLGGRERIMVVEVGDQWIVVGASPGRMNALATMPKQPDTELGSTLAPNPVPASSFAEWLKQTIDKRNVK